MLERLFLQAERFALGEDRRRARRDPGEPRLRCGGSSVEAPVWRLSIKPVCRTSSGEIMFHVFQCFNYWNWNWS